MRQGSIEREGERKKGERRRSKTSHRTLAVWVGLEHFIKHNLTFTTLWKYVSKASLVSASTLNISQQHKLKLMHICTASRKNPSRNTNLGGKSYKYNVSETWYEIRNVDSCLTDIRKEHWRKSKVIQYQFKFHHCIMHEAIGLTQNPNCHFLWLACYQMTLLSRISWHQMREPLCWRRNCSYCLQKLYRQAQVSGFTNKLRFGSKQEVKFYNTFVISFLI